jgi:hypothetical protein
LRDASLFASYCLAPTKNSGFNTIEIGRPDEKPAILSKHGRDVLRSNIKHPLMRNRCSGAFVGEFREVDMDANRFHLRNIPEIGSLRCVMQLSADEIRRVIGISVRVEGVYETDGNDKPRLMQVENIEPYQTQKSL